MTETIRPYGPGKFSTILDSYVYSVSLDGGADEESGSVSETGRWYGLMRNGSTIFRGNDPLLGTLNDAEREELTSSAAVILTEDSQGFVDAEYYEDLAEAERIWASIIDEADEAADQA